MILTMNSLSVEFCAVTFLISSIFLINILNILYMIIYQINQHIRPIRLVFVNASISSLIVSIWLIPFFYFRQIWPSDSFEWRCWSLIFHICDAVQIYSLFTMITVRSFQRLCIFVIWISPIIAYSPLLWLPTFNKRIDYLPYRRFNLEIPHWILKILYSTMYIIPIFIQMFVCLLKIYQNSRLNRTENQRLFHSNEHQKDMAELTKLIHTVLTFHLNSSTNQIQSIEVRLVAGS